MNQSISPDALNFFQQSLICEQKGDFNQSYQLLLSAVEADENMPGAWNNLGVRLHVQRRWAAAASAFYRAHILVPDATLPYANYAWNLHLSGREEEALEIMKDVIVREPNNAQHLTNFSQINLTIGNREIALEHAKMAVQADPSAPMPMLALALAKLRMGYYAEGLRYYEARFPYIPVLAEYLKYPYPIWRGEDLTNKTLFISCEQGLGDSVMFMRFIPEAIKRARKVIIYVHDGSFSLYQRNLSGRIKCKDGTYINAHGKVEIYPLPRELPVADYFSPLISLAIGLGLNDEQINSSWWPYRTQEAPIKIPKKEHLRVGICWAGDPNHDNDRNRSMNIEAFLALSETPNIRLYSLQVGPRSKDVDNSATHGIIKSLTPYLRTVADTAAVIKECLDVVVTVDTSVAHIAGIVGARTYMLLGKHAVDWRWQSGDGKIAWYPTMTMMLQEKPGDWLGLIERLKKELAK